MGSQRAEHDWTAATGLPCSTLQTKGLQQQTVTVLSFGGQKSQVVVSAGLVSSEAFLLCRQLPSVCGLCWHGLLDPLCVHFLCPRRCHSTWIMAYLSGFVTSSRFESSDSKYSLRVRASPEDFEGPPSAHHICIRGSEWCTRECFSHQPLVRMVIVSVSHTSRQKVEKNPSLTRYTHLGVSNSCVLQSCAVWLRP